MTRFRTGLLWVHTASIVAVALLGFQYSSRPIPEISLLVEVVHHAVTTWFYPEPFLIFLILALSGWLCSTFGVFTPVRYAIGSFISLLLFAWWAALLGPGALFQRLPEFLLLGSTLVGVSALAPFRPVALLVLETVRFGILPVMTLHRVSSSLNKLLSSVSLQKTEAVSTLARHAARARTDFLLTRVHRSFSLKVDSALLTNLVTSLKDEYVLGREAMRSGQADVPVHIDRLNLIYSTLMLVESHQQSEYHSDALLEMFDWNAERPVANCFEIFDVSPNTEERICASSTLFKEKQWGLLLYSGESLVPYPIRALKLRAAGEILQHLEDSNKPEYREVFARQAQLMRELHLTGSLSEGCVIAPTSPLSLSNRSESRHLEKSGFSAPFSFVSLPIFDGTPGLQFAAFFIVLLSAWFTTDKVGLELGEPLRQFSTAYLPESDPRRVAQDDRITDIHTLSGQPIVARIQRKRSDELQDGYLRIDPQNYDIDVINLPLDLASSSRVLVDSFQAPNGFHILTGSSADSKSNLAHFLLPPEGTKQSDWRTVHAPIQDFGLGAILDARWLTPDMQFIIGDQGICLYRPSAITEGQNGYQFLPYDSPAGVVLSGALLTQSELHMVFEYAGEVHCSRPTINSIKKTFESSESSLKGLFAGGRVLPRFEIGEDFQIHPGPSNSVFVQGSKGTLLHVDDDIHIVRWGRLPELRNPEFVFLGDYALAFDQSQLLLHRSAESEPSSWWATKNLTLGEDGALNEVDLFSEPLPDCFLAVHESDSQTQLTLLVHKRELESETGLLYRFKIDPSGKISDGELFIPDVVDFSVSSDGQNCALTARFSRYKDDKAKYEVLLTFSSELAGTQNFDHGEQDRLSAFQKFLPLALFDNRNQLAVRSPMPPAFAGQQLALSYDPQNGLHSILTSSGEIQAYSEARLSSVGNVELLPSFPAGKNVTVDFFTDRGVNHVLTVQPNHQVDRWKGEEHQAFSWHYPRWGSSRPNGNRVVLSPGSDDFVISDGVSLYHHAVSGGWRPLKSPLDGRPLPADQLFSLSTEPNRDSLLFSIVADGLFSTLLEVKSGGGGVQPHRLPQKIDQGNSSWMLSPAESPKLVFRSTDSDGAARWFSWDKKDSEFLLHSADPSSAAGKVIDLCDMDLSSENEGLLILGEKGLNYCRNTQSGFTRQFISHLDLDDSGSLFKPSQLVDTSSDFVWALYESGDETKPALVTPNLKVLQKQPTLLASSVTTDDGQGFVGLSRRTREPVQFGSSTECIPLLPNARFAFEPEGLEVVRWLPGQDHLHLVALSSGQPDKKSLLTLDGFGRLQQSLLNFRFDGDIQSAHLIGSTTHIFTDQSWYSLSGTKDFRRQRSGRWFANSFPEEQVGLAWQVGNADGTEPVGKAIGLGALSKLQLPGARAQSSGSPSRVVPAFSGLKGDYYLAAERGMYRWGGLAQGFTSFPIPESGAKDIRTWLRSDRGGAPIAVASRSGEEPSFYQFDFNTKSFVDLGIDLNSWSQDSPEHAWAVGWRGSDWFADVENSRLVSKQEEYWGGWSTGRLDETPEVWNVQGREYLLDASGRLLRLDVRAGQWRALFGGQKFRSIHPVPRSSSGVASEQTQFIARSQGQTSTWKHLQLGQSEREYSEIILKPNTEPSYDSERFLGLTPDGQEFIEYTWKDPDSVQKYKRSVFESARVLARASDTSVWAEQGSLLREINLSSGQWSSREIDTKPGSVTEVAGENDLLLYKDASSARPHLVRSGRKPRMLSRATSGYQLVDGWDAVGISDGSDDAWLVSDGETSFRVPHKIPYDIGEVQSTFVEDNNLLVVSENGVSRFVNDEWQDVTRSLPVEMGVVDNRWCYLQNGTLLDQNKVPLPGYSGVRAIFSSPEGTLVVNRDWRCSWHSMKSGRIREIRDPDNYLHQQYQGVSNAAQFPTQGTARFLTWSSQGKSYVHLPDGNPPQQFNGPPPTIWLSPSHPEPPVFNRKLNIISAKSQSDEPELITPSSAYFATEDMLFRDGIQVQDSKQTITVRAMRSSSGTHFLRIPGKSAELNFVRSDSGAWIFEDLSEWTEQKLAGTSATLVKAKDDDSVGFLTDEVGRTQEVQIKTFDQIDDKTLNTVLNDVFGNNADRIPNTFCDRVFVQFDSGATVSYQIIESSSITRLRSDVVPVTSSSRTLPYVIAAGQIGIRHEGDFLPMLLWDRVPTVLRGGQKTWGNFNPSANGVVSATNWILSTRLPIGVEWLTDGTPQIQRGNRVGIPTVWSSTSLSGHLSLGSNPDWSGDPRKGMVHQGRPLGKLKPQGFESHLRMRRKEFIPVSYQGSLGVVRVVDDQLWLQSEDRWQELPRGMESKVIRGLSSEVTLRPNTNPTEPVNGTLLRWKPSTNEIGCDQGANFYPLSLADFSQAAPFVCARPSGFGYRSAREDNVVFSYSLSGQDYQSASGNLTFPNVLDLLRQKPAQPSRTTASVPNPLPPSRIQNVNSSFVRSEGRFALAWHLVDQVRPTRTPSNSVVVSKGSGSNYVIRADGNIQGARPLRPLPSWSDADGLPFRPAAEASRWEIQLPTLIGLRQWIPAGDFDRGNFALLQLDESAELRKFDDDVWIIRHGGFSLGWSESSSDFVAAPGLGISAPEFTSQCGSYEVSIKNGQFGRISHSDIGLVVFNVNGETKPSEVTSGGWLPQFEPQDIQYVQSVSATEKGDEAWCIQLPDNSWVTVNEDSMRWKRSGPPRGQVDSPVLNFGLLAGLSRKQIRESRIETPLNIDLGVFEFEIPDQLQVGFDQESRIIVMADDQKFLVDRSVGIKLLPEAKISVVQPEVDLPSSNLVLGLTPTALEAGGTTYELKRDGRLAWSPYPGLTFQESEQSGVFDHNRVLRAFFTTASNRYLTTFDGGFVVRGPEALSICSDDLVEFQRDLDGELHASISVDCGTSFGTDYQSSISPEVMRRSYAVSASGWVQPDQGFIEADGRLPNSRLGWIGVYPNGVAEIVGDRSRFLTREQSGISKPKNSFNNLPCEISQVQHLNGGLFVENPEQSFAVELSEHLGLGVEGLRSVRHDWSPAYQSGLTISTQSIQTKDGRHIVTTKSSRRRPKKSGVLEEPTAVALAAFPSHAMKDVTTVLDEGGDDNLRLYILGSSLSQIDFDEKTGSSEFVKMFDPESSDEIAASSSGEVYLRADGADWLELLDRKPIGEDQLGSRWVNDTLEAFSGTFDWTLWEDPNGVLKYSSNLHDSLKNRTFSEDLIPEWPWDRLVASGFDFDNYPCWSSTKLHLRRSAGLPSSSGSLSQQKSTFTHARQKVYSGQGSAHIPVECSFPSSPSIPLRNFPLSELLQDGSLALDIANQAPVMFDLSSELRYPVDFGDGLNTPVANAERIDDDLWILNQRGQLRWVPIMQEWFQQLVVEDQQGGAAAGATEPSNSFTREESEGSEADSRSSLEQPEKKSGNLQAESFSVGESTQPSRDLKQNTSPVRTPRTVKIGMYPNMHFSVARFVAQTGERLTVEFENDDPQAQPHNLVFTKPGRRMKVFADMMRMGPKAVGSGYIPTKSRSVLKEGDDVVAISLLNPGESGSVTFTAPEKAGAYPFACIYPGHQVSMYGVMHVVEDPAAAELPAEDADPGIPPGWNGAKNADSGEGVEQKSKRILRPLPF